MIRDQVVYHVTGINPEPWASPLLSIGWRGRNPYPRAITEEAQRTYQAALAEEIVQQNGHVRKYEGPLHVEFFFWRRLDGDDEKTRHAMWADATNLQKSTEDALQGILYGNDRLNRWVSSEIVEQGVGVAPHIAIRVAPYVADDGFRVPVIPTYEATKYSNFRPRQEDLF